MYFCNKITKKRMKKAIYIFALLLILAGCQEQNSLMQQLITIDSISTQRGDEEALNMLDNIIPETITDEECIAYYWLLRMRTEIHLQKNITSSNNLDFTIKYYEDHKNEAKLARALTYKAFILERSGQNKDALICLKTAEFLVKDNGNENELARFIYADLSRLCYKAKELESAIKYEKNAIRKSRETGKENNIAYNLMRLYVIYKDLGKMDSATYYLNKCIPLVQEIPQEQRSSFYANIGNAYIDSDVTKAENYLHQSIAIKPNVFAYKGLARIYYKRGEREKARDMWQKTLQTDNMRLKAEVLEALYESQRDEGDYRTASETAIQIAVLKDSIAAQEKEDDIRGQQELFEQKNHEKQQKSRFTAILALVSALLFLTTAAAVTLYYRNQKGRKQQQATQQQLEQYRNQLKLLEKEGKTDTKEVERLTKKIAELQAKQGAQLQNGRERYEEVMTGGTTVRWSRNDFSDCIEYYRTQDAAFVARMESDYRHLSAKYIFFALMEHLGKTDEELQHLMAISQNTVRSYRSRINSAEIQTQA